MRFFEYFCNFYFCYSTIAQCKTSNKKLTPFVGAGIGMTLSKQGEISVDTDSDGINDTTFKPNYESSSVYEIQGGAKYAVSENVSILGSLSYRNYLRTRAFDITTYGIAQLVLNSLQQKRECNTTSNNFLTFPSRNIVLR